MPNSELMPIGVFAQRSGLTSSALRFYADSGLLPPAEVDPVSGYRHYGADQMARATALRRLREIAMPLAEVGTVLDAGAGEAARLVDEHVARVAGDATAASSWTCGLRSASPATRCTAALSPTTWQTSTKTPPRLSPGTSAPWTLPTP